MSGLAAVAPTAAAAALPAEHAADPIYAAIEEPRRTNLATFAIFDEEPLGDEDWEQRKDAASDREWEALGDLMRTTPTTLPGMAAYFQYLASLEAGNPKWPYANIEHVVSRWTGEVQERQVPGGHPPPGDDPADEPAAWFNAMALRDLATA